MKSSIILKSGILISKRGSLEDAPKFLVIAPGMTHLTEDVM